MLYQDEKERKKRSENWSYPQVVASSSFLIFFNIFLGSRKAFIHAGFSVYMWTFGRQYVDVWSAYVDVWSAYVDVWSAYMWHLKKRPYNDIIWYKHF